MRLDEARVKINGLTAATLDGDQIPWASLWRERRLVLAFLRHFG
jgi:hypothetical protein